MDAVLKMEPKLYARALQICKDEHKAKDAVQDVFLWAIENNNYETEQVMAELVKLALKQIRYNEVFIPTVSDEGFDDRSSAFARRIEAKTSISPQNGPLTKQERDSTANINPEYLTNKKDRNSKDFLTYEAAVAYMSTTGLRSDREWQQWKKDKLRPAFIPSCPTDYYAEKYTNIYDFLGVKKYFTYDEMITWVRKNLPNVVNRDQWKETWPNLPSNIARDPVKVYKNKGWINWSTFFGKKLKRNCSRKTVFRPYKEVELWVQSVLSLTGVNTSKKWRENMSNLPIDIPTSPHIVYKGKGWVSWGVFFGTEEDRIKRELFVVKDRWPYAQAREWVRLNARILGVTGFDRWMEWMTGKLDIDLAIPTQLPKAPNDYYKGKGWKNWGDFLGTLVESTAEKSKKFPKYSVLYEWMQKHMYGKNITEVEWRNWIRGEYEGKKGWPTPPFIVPSMPKKVYGKEWISRNEITGYSIGKKRKGHKQSLATFLAIENAIKYDKSAWDDSPEKLGISRKIVGVTLSALKRKGTYFSMFLNYEDSKKFVRETLKISGWEQFKKMNSTGEMPWFIPTEPNIYYKDKGWTSFSEFFGISNTQKRDRSNVIYTKRNSYESFEKCQKYAQEVLVPMGVNTFDKYVAYIKDHPELNIPVRPDGIYKDSFKGWPAFLGTKSTGVGTKPGGKAYYASYKDAIIVVRAAGISTRKRYTEMYKKLGINLPSAPAAVYEGWTDWMDFLGTSETVKRKMLV